MNMYNKNKAPQLKSVNVSDYMWFIYKYVTQPHFPKHFLPPSDICQHGRRAQRHGLTSGDLGHGAEEVAGELVGAQGRFASSDGNDGYWGNIEG